MIRWITENLGTVAYNSLPIDIEATIVDVRDLVDKSGNASVLVREKIDQALELLRSGQRVVVCCDYGMSRSNAIASGILSRQKKISFSDAVCQVMEATGEKDIKVEVLSVVWKSLGGTFSKQGVGRQNILLTGASGYIGWHLQQALASESNVFTSTRKEMDLMSDVVKLDLYVKQHNISLIIHFANPRVWNTNNSLGETLVMLRNILDVCKENDIKLIFPSHTEIFSGCQSSDLFLASENTEPQPRGLYGETKMLCETLISQYHVQYGLQYLIVRSPSIYGKSVVKPHFINRFIKNALTEQDIVTHVYRNGPPVIELLHIDDYICAMVEIAARDLIGILHLGVEQRSTSKEIALEICKLLNASVSVQSIDINNYASNVKMEYKRAVGALGWEPRVRLRDGFQELISLHKSIEMKGRERI